MENSKPRILIAAGIYPPDVGGPAIHVRKIAERLSHEGFAVQVIAYGDDPSQTKFDFKVTRISRKLPKFLQWISYLVLVFYHAISSKLVYAFDPTAAGVPAALAALVFARPFVIRVGGDPIWEREVETWRRFLPMDAYYDQGLYLKDQPVLYKVICKVLNSANRVVVYNQNFKDFFSKYFNVDQAKINIIKNPVFKRESASPEISKDPIILFAGRLVSYKNLPLVIRAFSNVGQGKLIIIGGGPEKSKLAEIVESLGLQERVTFINSLPQEKLFEYIKSAAICLGPALSEFNPNFILEALSFGKPVLLSQGHGLSVDLPKEFLFNPMSEKDLEDKLRSILESERYRQAVATVDRLPLDHSWEMVTDAHLEIIKDIIQK